VKTVAIVSISVVASVVAVLGVLFGVGAYEQLEYEKALQEYNKFYSDYLIASSYQNEINDFLIDLCSKTPMPKSLGEAMLTLRLLEGKHIEQELERIKSLDYQIKEIQEKYSGTQYYDDFNFDTYECSTLKEMAESLEKFYGNPDEIEKLAQKFQGDCLAKAQNPLEQNKCYAQIEEFRDTAKLVLVG